MHCRLQTPVLHRHQFCKRYAATEFLCGSKIPLVASSGAEFGVQLQVIAS